MAVLAEALRQGLTDMAVFAICDPAAVETLIEAGIGATVTLPLGGKLDMPAIGRRGEPLTLTGRVRIATDGGFIVTGPMMTGTRVSLGAQRRLRERGCLDRRLRAQSRALGSRLLPLARHRADGETLSPAQVAHPLSRRVPADRQAPSSNATASG